MFNMIEIMIPTNDVLIWLMKYAIYLNKKREFQEYICCEWLKNKKQGFNKDDYIELATKASIGCYEYYHDNKRGFDWDIDDIKKMCIALYTVKDTISHIKIPS